MSSTSTSLGHVVKECFPFMFWGIGGASSGASATEHREAFHQFMLRLGGSLNKLSKMLPSVVRLQQHQAAAQSSLPKCLRAGEYGQTVDPLWVQPRITISLAAQGPNRRLGRHAGGLCSRPLPQLAQGSLHGTSVHPLSWKVSSLQAPCWERGPLLPEPDQQLICCGVHRAASAAAFTAIIAAANLRHGQQRLRFSFVSDRGACMSQAKAAVPHICSCSSGCQR